jgi:AcrR family transcriptional regulator
MTTGALAVTADSQDETHESLAGRADTTRQLLLQAARRRFAIDGYGSTTVREIANDAGVNVALINRYFESKEGLFEACLVHAAEQVHRPAGVTLDQVVQTVADRIAASPGNDDALHLLLLLRSSGDERADAIRRKTLRSFSERIAAFAGWTPGEPDGDELLLRAEVAISMSLGIALLRTSSGLEPLTSATSADLTGAISDAFSALLTPHAS